MASRRFYDQVNDWVRMAENRMETTLKESAQDLTEQVQKPRAKGGRLPIDTGFLRNSLTGTIGGVPSGQGQPPPGYTQQQWNASPITLVINQVKLGDRLVLGYLAEYAPEMEARYAFTRSAAQNWNQIVIKAAQRVERTVKR